MTRARELQHVQTNLVRRIIAGTVSPTEIRISLEPLGLNPEGQYLAVCARPGPAADIHTIEEYLGVDGMRGRRQGLTALVDGTLCGFVLSALPRQPAPTTIGVSEPAALTGFEAPFRRANRALITATAFGASGVFAFSPLALQAGIVGDPDVGEVLRTRYIDPLQSVAGGAAILNTVQHYLSNDGRVDETADALGIHVNTVRHRLKRFEGLTGRPLTNSEVAIELWHALEADRLLNDNTRA
jgi:hypothetical protein